VELRNALEAATGLRLPPTLVFDYPSPAAMSSYLEERLAAQQPAAAATEAQGPSAVQLAPQPASMAPRAALGSSPAAAIAVVASVVKVPGDVYDLPSWGAADAITAVPNTRWDVEQVCSATGDLQTRFGSFLSHPSSFDAAAFGLSDAEAQLMDPQQRLLLQLGFQALSNAGAYAWHSSAAAGEATAAAYRTSCGSFVGVSSRDYFTMGLQMQQVRHGRSQGGAVS
jgi:hypothetical protein